MKYPPIHYHEYLNLDALLGAQKPKSDHYGKPAHEEMLFIIVHQTYELWFKQILTELTSVLKMFSQTPMPEKNMGLAVRRLHRIVSVQRLINIQIDVMETMSPLEFLEFREFLYPASGFQSFQWRKIETMLGLKVEDRLKYNDSPFFKSLAPEQQAEMQTVMGEPSLYDLVDRWLTRTPFLKVKNFNFWTAYQDAVRKMFEEDRETVNANTNLSNEQRAKTLQMIGGSESTFNALFDEKGYETLRAQGSFRLSYSALHAALLIQLYRDQPLFQLPFQLLQALLDIDELMTQWRSRHALMAHRMLGQKIGTGGSSGHDYLKSATEKHKIFTDFFNLSTFFIPASRIPPLPPELIQKMGYQIS